MYPSFTIRLRSLSFEQDGSQIHRFLSQSLFTKLFKTNDLQTITECQSYFGFQLPSVRLSKRSTRFDDKYSAIHCSALTTVHCSFLAAVLVILHLYFASYYVFLFV